MSFRKSRILLSEAIGTYVNGYWVPGVRSNSTVMCSGQPVTNAQDLKPLPEGRHMSDFSKFYTSVRLKVAADGEGIQPDIIVHEGYGYEIVSLDTNQSDVINHYKFIGVKVFKFTTISDWQTGILKRP
jgi:hypothetical protein